MGRYISRNQFNLCKHTQYITLGQWRIAVRFSRSVERFPYTSREKVISVNVTFWIFYCILFNYVKCMKRYNTINICYPVPEWKFCNRNWGLNLLETACISEIVQCYNWCSPLWEYNATHYLHLTNIITRDLISTHRPVLHYCLSNAL